VVSGKRLSTMVRFVIDASDTIAMETTRKVTLAPVQAHRLCQELVQGIRLLGLLGTMSNLFGTNISAIETSENGGKFLAKK
jgi:hypothetical protein